MKKCAVVYTRESTGEQFWASSFDHNGNTYCLVPRKSETPQQSDYATEFYSDNRLKRAQDLIARDTQFVVNKRRKHKMLPPWFGYIGEVIEYESEPHWYFQIWHELKHAYKTNPHYMVSTRFPLNPDVQYRMRNGYDRPFIEDLPLEELQRYYEWRKENYKGNRK